MPKFSAIAEGVRARKRGVECTTLSGAPFTCDLRVIDGDEELKVLKYANEESKKVGAEPVETNLVWQYNCATYEVFLAAVDPESPDDAPVPFFDSVEQIRKFLDRDRILLLGEVQRRHQEEASPRIHNLPVDKAIQTVMIAAAIEEGAELPFARWPRRTLESFTHFTCVHLTGFLTDKSLTGTSTDAAVSSSPESSTPNS